MNEVVLIRCLDEWYVFFLFLFPVIFIRRGVRTLSFFFDFFFVAILGRFREPAGTPKSTKNRFFGKKRRAREQFFDDFCGACLFCRFFRRFSFDFSLKIDVFSSVVSLLIACFFALGDPHDSMAFTIRKLLFHFLCFCVFSKKTSKTTLQNRDHGFSLKNH